MRQNRNPTSQWSPGSSGDPLSSRSKKREIVVLGFRGVGKSSITIQFVENTWVETYYPTIENTFEKNMVVHFHTNFIFILVPCFICHVLDRILVEWLVMYLTFQL